MAGLYLTGFGLILMVAAWALHKLNTRIYLRRLARATEAGAPEPSTGLYRALDMILFLLGRGLGFLLVVMGVWLLSGTTI